ncbi:hypothetical protein BSKO_12852 [Bryopsis sp. KO-2023]|nr:hypothetical protein BSKO_12852 [Bryopsis sp. KO-2023]
MDVSTTAQLSAILINSGLLSSQFDSLRCLESSSGARGFVADLVRIFLDDSDARIDRMEAILRSSVPDLAELERLANKMLGSSDTFGAVAVAHYCKILSEELAQRFDSVEFSGILSRIKTELATLRPLLELYLTLEKGDAPSAASSDEVLRRAKVD